VRRYSFSTNFPLILILTSRFRWVFCQLEVLRHCLAPSLRDQLNELPKSLDATYERVLDEIQSTNQGRHAHRLLQCLTVAMRPLRVEELAEVLAFELDTAGGELPRYHPDWRWEDQEHAVLSACSSLITIVNSDNARVIQFSHFSVKEYLTSKRLSAAIVDASRYYIALEPAHLVLARACLGALLDLDTCAYEEYDWPESSDESGGEDGDEGMPLRKYAADHWTSHAQVGNVSSCLKDTMETLFDPNKPYFEAWRLIYDEDEYRSFKQSHLYYAALHGFYDLVQHLIDRHPEQVTHHNGGYFSPLVAALESSKHVRLAELLLKHGAHVHIRRDPPLCHTARFSDDRRVTAVQFLLKHGAHVNAGDDKLWTPLHYAAAVGCPEVAQILLEHGADVGLRNDEGQVPLHLVSVLGYKDEGDRSALARLLLVGDCADVNLQDMYGATPLHGASYNRRPKIAQLLLDHGANAHAEDHQGRNPLHQCHHLLPFISEVDSQDVLRVTRLLLEEGVDVNALDHDHETPLHIASSVGNLEITRFLLDNGAKADAENIRGQTPLHLVSQRFSFYENASVARLLLQLGMDVNKQDKHLETPLHSVSSTGHSEIAMALIDHGADVNAQNADGRTPLHLVSLCFEFQEHDYPCFSQLMLEHGADVNARDKDQATPLHSACYMSKLETARVLLDYGANIHAKNARGQTPLHIVSHGVHEFPERSESALVELLLSRGGDVNAQDNDHATPFLLACFCLKIKTAKKLLQNGTDVNAVNIRGQNAWHLISHNLNYGTGYMGSDRESLRARLGELLLGHEVGVHARDKDERTPLHLACYYGQVDAAEMLLGHGAQVNAADIRGHTPLHRATLGNHDYRSFGLGQWDLKDHPGEVLRLAKRLLESGTDVNAPNKDQETPLHLASRFRLHDMARLLLKHGANVNVMNTEGKSPLQLATGRKGKAMRRLLSEYSAK
jgi:ankyrin repeat protein